MAHDDLDAELGHRRAGEGEHRLPPALAVLVAIVTYALLPQPLLVGPRLAIPAVEVLLLLSLVLVNPVRLVRRTRWSRWVSVGLAGVVILSNLVALGMLVATLSDSSADPGGLLLGGMQVWLTGVVGYALLYWELDRGGPVARHRERRDRLPPADWRFSQDEDHDTVAEVAASSSRTSGWVPLFVDYLYVSVTNSSAFSPTDTMPLSTRAKLLMASQATAALLVSLIVVARAVGSLGG
ncbi:hypothetical protein KMZ32_12355 [Phycicoccus sp. MAQZ13P-2]|uniref:hypothetical protein n=1 Tax=Phycicoccus mangrovi TaxID=2840470 RepID=UPI001C000481|nr:hypothetical protein [Phycicoccus mangrovi]MBT9256988.1 hypothetical protein [Phycicoccus mangrovi]MBT9274864.1 hypothetical protein [Phycicoccus mangrovi]